jgi:type I restriction enzyme S subunit
MVFDTSHNSRFIEWFYKSHLVIQDLIRNTKGIRPLSLQLSRETLKEVDVLLPPLSEQEQIVSFLDEKTSKIDDLIKKKYQKIELLKEYRTSLINRVITKGLNPDVPMKDSGVEWIGEIPSHWEVKRLKHFYGYKKGVNGQRLTKEYVNEYPGEYPVYSGTTKGNGELGRTNEYEFEYENKVIFMSTVGSDTTVMSTRLVSGRFNLSQNCLIMIPIRPIIVDYTWYLTCIDFNHRRNLLPVILKEGHRSVGMGDLDQYHTLFPPLHEQEQIVSYLDRKTGEIDSTIDSEKKKIDLLKEYRQSLISSVITGKIKVVD